MSNAEDPVKAEGKGAEDANIVSIRWSWFCRTTNSLVIHNFAAISSCVTVISASISRCFCDTSSSRRNTLAAPGIHTSRP